MRIALCPGSFDPPTNGHVDVVERAARHFDRVVIAVVRNPGKNPLFEHEERAALLKESLDHLKNVEVVIHDGLLVDLAREMGAGVVVKGLRAVSDLEYELQMAQMNATLLEGLDTLFFATDPKWSFVSSSLVKEVARLGGAVGGLVPRPVMQALQRKYPEGNTSE